MNGPMAVCWALMAGDVEVAGGRAAAAAAAAVAVGWRGLVTLWILAKEASARASASLLSPTAWCTRSMARRADWSSWTEAPPEEDDGGGGSCARRFEGGRGGGRGSVGVGQKTTHGRGRPLPSAGSAPRNVPGGGGGSSAAAIHGAPRRRAPVRQGFTW